MTQPYDFEACWPPGLPPDIAVTVAGFFNHVIESCRLRPPFTLSMIDQTGAEKRAELDLIGDDWCPRCNVVHRYHLGITRISSAAIIEGPPFWMAIGDRTRKVDDGGYYLHIRHVGLPELPPPKRKRIQ